MVRLSLSFIVLLAFPQAFCVMMIEVFVMYVWAYYFQSQIPLWIKPFLELGLGPDVYPSVCVILSYGLLLMPNILSLGVMVQDKHSSNQTFQSCGSCPSPKWYYTAKIAASTRSSRGRKRYVSIWLRFLEPRLESGTEGKAKFSHSWFPWINFPCREKESQHWILWFWLLLNRHQWSLDWAMMYLIVYEDINANILTEFRLRRSLGNPSGS